MQAFSFYNNAPIDAYLMLSLSEKRNCKNNIFYCTRFVDVAPTLPVMFKEEGISTRLTENSQRYFRKNEIVTVCVNIDKKERFSKQETRRN